MKNLFTILLVALACVPGLFGQNEGDSVYVSTWTAPVPGWWAKPAAGAHVQGQATAMEVASFDAAGCDFDTEWAKIPVGNDIDNQLGLNASHTGAADFADASFKVMADASNMYILVKYTDNDVTGNETVEVAWAPYMKIKTSTVLTGLEGAWYTRFEEFGAYKATFKKTGFDAAMIVTGATGNVNWGGTNEYLAGNLFVDDHTTAGSSTVKQIITIGYTALTGLARPDFTMDIWNSLNSGKGISFDLKVNDIDNDDALNADPTPVKKPAEYWWNTTANDCYALTWYAGFLNLERIPLDPDAEFTKTWTAPVPGWWAKPSAEAPAVAVALAIPIETFDAQGMDFDNVWDKINAENTIDNQLGLAASHTGPNDFTDASYKVFCDATSIYVLVKYTDDDVTGNETVEIAWAPYQKLNAPALTGLEGAWYTRFEEFGAYKATFKNTGFDAAMIVTGATGNVNWGGTNAYLAGNLFVDNHTTAGSSTVKQIFTIGYTALTGAARPEFSQVIWKELNEGKGISFDLKVNDVDTDDALNADPTPVKKPAEYWWNTTANDCYALTYYAGLLKVADVTAVPQNKVTESIFSLVTPDQIQFKTAANVVIYNTLGQQIMTRKNVNQIDLNGLQRGIYIVRANNESRKIVH